MFTLGHHTNIAPYASKEDHRRNLCGIAIQKNRLLATNGHCLAEVRFPDSECLDFEGTVLVPIKVWKSLQDLCKKKNDTCTITKVEKKDESTYIVHTKSTYGQNVVCGTFEAQSVIYPDVAQVIPAENRDNGCGIFGVDPKYLYEAGAFFKRWTDHVEFFPNKDPIGPMLLQGYESDLRVSVKVVIMPRRLK